MKHLHHYQLHRELRLTGHRFTFVQDRHFYNIRSLSFDIMSSSLNLKKSSVFDSFDPHLYILTNFWLNCVFEVLFRNPSYSMISLENLKLVHLDSNIWYILFWILLISLIYVCPIVTNSDQNFLNWHLPHLQSKFHHAYNLWKPIWVWSLSLIFHVQILAWYHIFVRFDSLTNFCLSLYDLCWFLNFRTSPFF